MPQKPILTRDARVARWARLPRLRPANTYRSTRRRGRSSEDTCMRVRRSSDSHARQASNAESILHHGWWYGGVERHWSSYPPLLTSRIGIGTWRNRFFSLRSESHEVHRHPNNATSHCEIPNPLQRSFPQPHRQRNLWIFRQAAIKFGILGIVQNINHMRSAHSGRIVHSCVGKSGHLTKLCRSRLRQFPHFRLRTEMEAARRACLNASRLESHRHAVVAQRALKDLARRRTKFRNIKRATGHAISTTDAVRFLEIDNAVGVLDDGAIRRAGRQATRISAVHALIFAH